MKVLVIGREGQLARSLGERANRHPGIELVFAGRPDLDLLAPRSATTVILTVRPEVVINAAAFTAVDVAETQTDVAMRINREGAREVAKAAAEVGAAMMQISTDYVFDGRSSRAYLETDAPAPINVYGRSKLAGEEAVREAAAEHLILRTSWLFSPFNQNFVKTMVVEGQKRDVLKVVDDQRGNPTSALDLADALLRIAKRLGSGDRAPSGATYHLAGTGVASWFELAQAVQQRVAEAGHAHARVRPIGTADWPTPAARPLYSALDCTNAARDFGITLPDWRESVAPIVKRVIDARSAA